MKLIIKSGLITFGILTGYIVNSFAGVITHTDYNAGDVITSALQNTNENAIVNEINGALDTANFEDGGVATADLADNAVTQAKLATIIQSTFTFSNQRGLYKRPKLEYQSGTAVNVSTNSSTANTTCITFPDEVRCVTENVASTNKYRQASTAVNVVYLSGTEDSGMGVGETVAVNTWYGVYAVKSQVSASNFVLVLTTVTYNADNFARLNTLYQTNGWVYLGLVRRGDKGGVTNEILEFKQTGHLTMFKNDCLGDSGVAHSAGIALQQQPTDVSFSSYTYVSGTGSNQIPSGVENVIWTAAFQDVGTVNDARSSFDTDIYFFQAANSTVVYTFTAAASLGVRLSHNVTGNSHYVIYLNGFYDDALNPSF